MERGGRPQVQFEQIAALLRFLTSRYKKKPSRELQQSGGRPGILPAALSLLNHLRTRTRSCMSLGSVIFLASRSFLRNLKPSQPPDVSRPCEILDELIGDPNDGSAWCRDRERMRTAPRSSWGRWCFSGCGAGQGLPF
jgi:hypothetical protein